MQIEVHETSVSELQLLNIEDEFDRVSRERSRHEQQITLLKKFYGHLMRVHFPLWTHIQVAERFRGLVTLQPSRILIHHSSERFI